jgi:hypothetical protein
VCAPIILLTVIILIGSGVIMGFPALFDLSIWVLSPAKSTNGQRQTGSFRVALAYLFNDR